MVNTIFNHIEEELLDEAHEKYESIVTKPVLVAEVGSTATNILSDTCSELSCISQDFVNALRESSKNLLSMPTHCVTIIGALQGKSQKVEEQVFC